MRGVDEPLAIAGEVAIAHVVGQDEDDVRALRVSLLSGGILGREGVREENAGSTEAACQDLSVLSVHNCVITEVKQCTKIDKIREISTRATKRKWEYSTTISIYSCF